LECILYFVSKSVAINKTNKRGMKLGKELYLETSNKLDICISTFWNEQQGFRFYYCESKDAPSGLNFIICITEGKRLHALKNITKLFVKRVYHAWPVFCICCFSIRWMCACCLCTLWHLRETLRAFIFPLWIAFGRRKTCSSLPWHSARLVTKSAITFTGSWVSMCWLSIYSFSLWTS